MKGIEHDDEIMNDVLTFLQVPVFQLDDRFNVVYCNDAWQNLTGRTAQEVLHRHVMDIFQSPDLSTLQGVLNDLDKSSIERSGCELLITHKNTNLWLEVQLSRQINELSEKVYWGSLTDISKRKSDALKLEEKEKEVSKLRNELWYNQKRLQTILDATDIGLWEWSSEDNQTSVSPSCFSMLGYAESEVDVVNDFLNNLIHPDDKSFVKEALSDFLSGKNGVYDINFRLRHKSGAYKYINSKGFAVDNEEGHIHHIMGVHENVSDRVEYKRKIIESEKKFRQIFENLSDIYFRSDMEGTLEMISPSVTRVLKYAQNEMQERNLISFCEDKDNLRQLIDHLNHTGEVVNYSCEVKDKEGQVHYLSTNIRYVCDEAGNRVAVEGFVRDLSDQYLFEKALKASEERYKLLSDLTIEGIILHEKGKIRNVNNAFLKMFGYPREDLISKNIITIAVAREYVPLVKEKIKEGYTLPYHIEMIKKGEERFWVETESRNIVINRAKFRVTAFRDISKHKKNEAILFARNEMLKSIEKGISVKMGVDFFETLVKELSEVLKASQVFIGEYEEKSERIVSISNFNKGEKAEKIEFDLHDTASYSVIHSETHCYPEKVSTLFPSDKLLMENSIEGYAGAPLFDSKGETIGLLVALFDHKIEEIELTTSILQIFSSRAGVEIERLKMLEELTESRRRFETLLSTLNGVFWIRDIKSMKFEYVSPQYNEIWLKDRSFLYERPMEFIKSVHPEDKQSVIDRVHMVTKGVPVDIEYRIIRPNGELRYIKSSSTFITNKKDGRQREYGYGEDVTTTRIAEMEIKKLALVAKSTTNGVIILNANGEIEWVNDAIIKLNGYEQEEIIGKRPQEFLYLGMDQKEGASTLKEGFFKKKNFNNEVKVKTKNGKYRWVKLNIQQFYEPITRSTKYVALEVDITKIKKSEKAIHLQNQKLIKTNQELDNFVYRVSHDLKAPISSVKGLVNIARIENEKDSVGQCLDLIDGSMHKLEKFIAEILDYSRNARMKISVARVNLRKIMEAIFADLNYIEGASKVKKVIDIPENLTFFSDEKRLLFIFNNLISNAIRFSDFTKEKPFIKIRVSDSGKNIEIVCEDNGIGIEKEHQPYVFDMFYRASEVNPGSGLGLYIVKESLEKLGGHIELRSVAGKGTKFIMKIPNKAPSEIKL